MHSLKLSSQYGIEALNVVLYFDLSSTLKCGRFALVGYSAVVQGLTSQVVIPAIRCIALVKSYHDIAPSSLK